MRVNSFIACGAIGVFALGLAGCGSENKGNNSPTATAGTSGAQVEIGNTQAVLDGDLDDLITASLKQGV